MKIAVVHSLVQGGARRRLYEQMAAIDEEVVEVTTSAALPITDRPYVVAVQQRSERLPAASRPPARYLDLHSLARTWRRLGEIAAGTGADVIYANPDSTLRGAVPLPVDGLPVLRYCDEPRRIDYEPGQRATQRRRSRLIYGPLRAQERKLDRAAITSADLLATNSTFTAAWIERAYGRDATVIRCGVPAAMTPCPGTTPGHVLIVGAMLAGKGHDLALRATAMSGVPYPVVLVSPRAIPAEERRLRQLAGELGVGLDIRIGVTDAELVELYRSAFATLYLARAEPLGLVSLEAQACGSPVVVSDEGGLPETVLPGLTGYAVPRDAAAAAHALTLLRDPATRQRMAGAAARHGAASTWSALSGGLMDALRSARDGHTASLGTRSAT